MRLDFTKMHGAGNDYIYVYTPECPIHNPEELAVRLSQPHFGIGSDGLILIGKSETSDADFTMRIFNADGSEAMMCGNGIRCVGKYLADRQLVTTDTVRVNTLSGVKTLRLIKNADGVVDRVSVDMGTPSFTNLQQLATPDGTLLDGNIMVNNKVNKGTFVSMGNPHFVCFVADINGVDVAGEGSALECHPLFPQRCNIEFAQIIDEQNIRVRVWERGSGITLACGTGACATAVAAMFNELVPFRQCNILMDGGTLQIEWIPDDNHVWLTGPATTVFHGSLQI